MQGPVFGFCSLFITTDYRFLCYLFPRWSAAPFLQHFSCFEFVLYIRQSKNFSLKVSLPLPLRVTASCAREEVGFGERLSTAIARRMVSAGWILAVASIGWEGCTAFGSERGDCRDATAAAKRKVHDARSIIGLPCRLSPLRKTELQSLRPLPAGACLHLDCVFRDNWIGGSSSNASRRALWVLSSSLLIVAPIAVR